MTNFIACIQNLFELLSHSPDTSVNDGEIDWQGIEDTRERLVKMRFKTNRAPYSWSGYMSDVYRPNTPLASNSTFAGTVKKQQEGVQRWKANDGETAAPNQPLEKPADQPPTSQQVNSDWAYRAPNVSYEPFLIPGVTCAKPPDPPGLE